MTVQEIVARELDYMILDIIRLSEEAGQRASGYTYSQIRREVEKQGNDIIGSIWAPGYFYTLLRGRGPGKIPANMAELIMEWAYYKGISFSDPKEFVRWANAVAWKIAREGSAMYRNGEYIDLIEEPINLFIQRLDERILEFYNTQITEAFEELIQDFRT